MTASNSGVAPGGPGPAEPGRVVRTTSPTRPGYEVFVSPRGRDDWSGTRPEPNSDGTDGPLATLVQARDALRELKRKDGLPAGGATVWIACGDYVLRQGLEFTEEDAGTDGAPVVWRAREGERVRLLGGRVVTNFEPVKDPEVLDRLGQQARRHVLQADLKSLVITDCGRLRSRGFDRPAVAAHTELFFDGRPMTLARWPNAASSGQGRRPDRGGFTNIAGVGEESVAGDGHGGQLGLLEEGFYYEGDRPRRWKDHADVWVHGYWAWDWSSSYEQVASIDLDRRLVKTRPPFGNHGYKDGQRFYFLNILEELGTPGEYYVDTEAGMLYFWPPAPPEDNEALVSVLEEPMVSVENASHLTLRGLVFECTRGHGIVIKGGEANLVAGCTIRSIGGHGVVIAGGIGHGVQACDISETGDSGIEITGGDRRTLTPCGHFVHNNHIWRFARWSRCYRPAVHAVGVGIRVTHNLMHDAPHSAVIYSGNENLIEFNEIHSVTLETGDCGAIYSGRDYTARGNVIRHNFIHHTGTAGKGGSMAVYLDDCLSGQSVVGNIFLDTTRAAFIGGGRDNVVVGNVFIDCDPAVHVDGRGLDRNPVWHNMIYRTMKERLDAVNHHEPPYSERYPELGQLDAFYEREDGIPPEGNVIARNVCVGGSWIYVGWHAEQRHLTIGENLVDADPLFVDRASDDLRLREDSPAWAIGFEPIPVEQIGLVKDEYRAQTKGPISPRADSRPSNDVPPPTRSHTPEG